MVIESQTNVENLNVLVVGNNPIELSHTFNSLKEIRNQRVVAEIAFDVNSLLERLAKFKPNFILVDDNIGRIELMAMVKALLANRKTRNVPITVLKNSNYIETLNAGALNYLLKTNVSGDSLYTAFRNSLKFQKTQAYLSQAYTKRKGQLLRLITP